MDAINFAANQARAAVDSKARQLHGEGKMSSQDFKVLTDGKVSGEDLKIADTLIGSARGKGDFRPGELKTNLEAQKRWDGMATLTPDMKAVVAPAAVMEGVATSAWRRLGKGVYWLVQQAHKLTR